MYSQSWEHDPRDSVSLCLGWGQWINVPMWFWEPPCHRKKHLFPWSCSYRWGNRLTSEWKLVNTSSSSSHPPLTMKLPITLQFSPPRNQTDLVLSLFLLQPNCPVCCPLWIFTFIVSFFSYYLVTYVKTLPTLNAQHKSHHGSENFRHILKYWGLELQHINLGGGTQFSLCSYLICQVRI